MSRPAAIGIDVGSTTWKAVVLDASGEVLDRLVEIGNPRIEEQTTRNVALLRERTGAPAGIPTGATGYGRKRVAASRVLTEITCHAKGAFRVMRGAGILVDIGGQDSKIIHVEGDGRVRDFAMNDKCAAGTGRFLEVILGRLHVSFDDAPALAARAAKPVPVSSTCTVFAESEVISLVAQGESVEGIVAGLHASLASRIASLAGKFANGTPIWMSGGVALNSVMVDAIGKAMGATVRVLPEPQFVGALGAALSVLP